MGKLICEICGGNNLVKKDGFFVCEDCNASYSVEEAKTLLGGKEEFAIPMFVDFDAKQLEASNSPLDYIDGFNVFTDDAIRVFKEYPCLANKDYLIEQGKQAIAKFEEYAKQGKRFYVLDLSDALVNAFKLAAASVIDAINNEYGKEKKEQTEDKYKIYVLRFKSALNLLKDLFSFDMHEATLSSLNKTICDACKNLYKSSSYYVTAAGRVEVDTILGNKEKDNLELIVKDIANLTSEIKKGLPEKEEALRVIKVKDYWEDHPEEKKDLDNQKANASARIKDNEIKIQDLNDRISDLRNSLPAITEEQDLEQARKELKQIQDKKKSVGAFNFKEKKQFDIPLAEAEKKVNLLTSIVAQKKAMFKTTTDSQIRPLQESIHVTLKEIEAIKKEIENIDKKLERRA